MFTAVGGGYYTIKSVGSEQYLTATPEGENHHRMIQYYRYQTSNPDADLQFWPLEEASNGRYRI